MPVIETQKLSKVYANGVRGLTDLSITVEAGEIFGFLGPNGAGKTTTVRLLNGTLAPTSGKSFVLGMESRGEELRKRTATLAELARMYDHLSAWENLKFFADLYDLPRGKAEDRIEELLRKMDLWDKRDFKLGGYSTGMRKRLHLIRTLLHKPEIVFFDEPTSGLDPASAREVNGLIRSLAREQGTTVFLCTHNLFLAEEICDSFGFLRNGSLVIQGNKQSLIDSVIDTRTVEIATGEGVERFPIETQDDISRHVASLVGAGRKIYGVTVPRPSLEEVYFSYIQGGDDEEK